MNVVSIFGGLLGDYEDFRTSTLLNMVVLPALYPKFANVRERVEFNFPSAVTIAKV